LHSCSSSRLDSGHTVFENQTFGGCDLLLFSFLADTCVDCLQGEEVDVWCRFALSGGDTGVIAEYTVLLLKY